MSRNRPAGGLSQRHRKSNHLWQRWLQPLHDVSAGALGASQPRAERVTSPAAPGSHSQPADVFLLGSFPAVLTEVCSRAEAAAAAAAAAENAAPSPRRGGSFPPPASGSASGSASPRARSARAQTRPASAGARPAKPRFL